MRKSTHAGRRVQRRETTENSLVPGVMDTVRPLTDAEARMYDDIDFDIEPYKKEIGVDAVSDAVVQPDKASLLMARWRYPSLSIHGARSARTAEAAARRARARRPPPPQRAHSLAALAGIEGAFSDPGAKTVIPRHVKGKFSIRIVPDQTNDGVGACVKKHLEAEFAKLGSPNKLVVTQLHGGPHWLAIHKVFGEEPDLTREGGSIPIANWLEDATQMSVMLLPTGACDDGAHSQNEKYDRINYIRGIKVLTTYIHEIGKLVGPKPSACRCAPPADMSVVGAFARGFRCKCEI